MLGVGRAMLGVLALLTFWSCDSSPAGKAVDASVFENAVGEAVTRHLIRESREELGLERPYVIVLGDVVPGEPAQGASAAFTERFVDTGETFVLESQLGFDRATKATVVEGTRTSPVVIQLLRVTRKVSGRYEVKAAWNYRADVVMKILEVTGDADDPGALEVRALQTLQERRKESRPPGSPSAS